jgi:hypothetical protein
LKISSTGAITNDARIFTSASNNGWNGNVWVAQFAVWAGNANYTIQKLALNVTNPAGNVRIKVWSIAAPNNLLCETGNETVSARGAQNFTIPNCTVKGPVYVGWETDNSTLALVSYNCGTNACFYGGAYFGHRYGPGPSTLPSTSAAYSNPWEVLYFTQINPAVRIKVYAGTGSAPVNLLCETDSILVTRTGMQNFTLPQCVTQTSGGYDWVGFETNYTGLSLYYTNDGTFHAEQNFGHAYGPGPSSAPTTAITNNTPWIQETYSTNPQTVTFKWDGNTLGTTPSTVYTNSTGGFSGVTFSVPSSSGGTHTVNASDSSGKFATATFTVTSQQAIKFDNATYAIESAGQITVNDPSASISRIANVTSNSDPKGILVTLNQNGTTSQFVSDAYVRFSSLPSASSFQSYVLHSSVNDIITATYATSSGQTVSATAKVSSSPLVGKVLSNISPLGSSCTSTSGDGICDLWKVLGSSPNPTSSTVALSITYGNATYKYYCGPSLAVIDSTQPLGTQKNPDPVCPAVGKKDVFVELDHMMGRNPSPMAIANVTKAFANSPNGGIQLHVQVNNEPIPTYPAIFFPSTYGNSTNPNFFTLKGTYFGTVSDRTCPSSIPSGACPKYVSDLLAAKFQVFHYGLWAVNQIDETTGTVISSSGRSDTNGIFPGNDFVVSLGSWDNGVGTVDQQAGTFMHELGHNLGLRHGGDEFLNCKPNYFSVMNYLYQMSTYLAPHRPLDYSESVVSSINENSINDNVGIGQTVPPNLTAVVPGYNVTSNTYYSLINTTAGSSPFDWNRNGRIDSGPYVFDVHNTNSVGNCDIVNNGPTIVPILHSFNDWAHLNFNFRSDSSGFQDGLSLPLTPQNADITPNAAEAIRIAIGAPHGIVDPTTVLPINNYVVDSGNNRTEVFNASGTFLSSFGSSGSGNGQFSIPTGITVDNAYNVYVVDSGNNRIEKFNSTGSFLLSFGSYGTGNSQFKTPTGAGVNTGGLVYIVDSGNNRIQEFNNTGGFVGSFGSAGTGNGKFKAPIGIAVDDPGYVYVVDSGNNRIEKFNSTGSFLLSFGSFGSSNGQFIAPTGIAVDNSGNVYVVDSGNNRIEKFSSIGAIITSFGSYGTGNGQFKIPTGITIDHFGNIYIVDSGNNRIEKFNSTRGFITSFGTFGSGNGQVKAPTGIAVNRFIP